MNIKEFDVVVINQEELKKHFGEEVKFSKGFLDEINNKTDFWNELEIILNRPIISIRPSGRKGWNEIIVFLAKGWIEDGYRILDYSNADDIKNVLNDIFNEFSVDEYEVFEYYRGSCSKKAWKEIDEWVHRTW